MLELAVSTLVRPRNCNKVRTITRERYQQLWLIIPSGPVESNYAYVISVEASVRGENNVGGSCAKSFVKYVHCILYIRLVFRWRWHSERLIEINFHNSLTTVCYNCKNVLAPCDKPYKNRMNLVGITDEGNYYIPAWGACVWQAFWRRNERISLDVRGWPITRIVRGHLRQVKNIFLSEIHMEVNIEAEASFVPISIIIFPLLSRNFKRLFEKCLLQIYMTIYFHSEFWILYCEQ